MNSHDLQNVLIKTAKIFAGEEIEVFMEGFQPRVEYNPVTKKPTRIFIPALPEEAPASLVKAIHGYIDHECSHIMFSDSDHICDPTKSKLWHFIHNCIEDPRVNKAIGEYYIGSKKNIRAGYSFLFNEKLPGQPKDQPGPYDKEYVDNIDFSNDEVLLEQQFRYASLWFAHKCGDELSGDKYKDLDLDRLFAPLEKTMDKRWIALLEKVSTANEVYQCADYFEQFFKDLVDDSKSKSSGGGDEDGDEKGDKGKKKKGGMGAGGYDFSDPSTLEEELGEKIKKCIEYGALKSKAGIHWTNRWDKVLNKPEILKECSRYSSRSTRSSLTVQAFEQQVRTVTNYLTKDLRRILEERQRRYYIGGFRRGKLNSKALASVKTGNDRIFKKKNEINDVNAAVSLLVDMSGSMSGDKIYVAMQSAYAFAMVLETIKVPYEVYGFSTLGNDRNMHDEYNKFVSSAGRDIEAKIVNESSPEVFYAFKKFNENFEMLSKEAMKEVALSKANMYQNEDSKHVKLALERVSARPERNKSLFVFSDGSPAYCTTHGMVGYDNLKYVANNAKEKYGVDIYSIGIQSDSVKQFYKNYKIINKVEELPTALFEFLRKAI